MKRYRLSAGSLYNTEGISVKCSQLAGCVLGVGSTCWENRARQEMGLFKDGRVLKFVQAVCFRFSGAFNFRCMLYPGSFEQKYRRQWRTPDLPAFPDVSEHQYLYLDRKVLGKIDGNCKLTGV